MASGGQCFNKRPVQLSLGHLILTFHTLKLRFYYWKDRNCTSHFHENSILDTPFQYPGKKKKPGGGWCREWVQDGSFPCMHILNIGVVPWLPVWASRSQHTSGWSRICGIAPQILQYQRVTFYLWLVRELWYKSTDTTIPLQKSHSTCG